MKTNVGAGTLQVRRRQNDHRATLGTIWLNSSGVRVVLRFLRERCVGDVAENKVIPIKPRVEVNTFLGSISCKLQSPGRTSKQRSRLKLCSTANTRCDTITPVCTHVQSKQEIRLKIECYPPGTAAPCPPTPETLESHPVPRNQQVSPQCCGM